MKQQNYIKKERQINNNDLLTVKNSKKPDRKIGLHASIYKLSGDCIEKCPRRLSGINNCRRAEKRNPAQLQAVQVYEDIAWGGLMETSSFDVLHPANSVSRQRIMNRTAAEQTGNPIAGGTPNEQLPYGQPCN